MENTKYIGLDLIENADKMAELICSSKRSNHHRDKFFPKLIDALNLKIGVEIGVDKGEFSNHILSRSKIEKYYCIDTWQDDFGSSYRPSYFDKDGGNRHEEAKAILSDHMKSERVELMKMTGAEASRWFKRESIDFCYIDGDHSLEGIFTDIKCWISKIKIGGIISGHDYKDGPKSGISDFFGKQLDFKVQTVVDYYAKRYGHKLNATGGRIKSWWFVKNKPTEDESNSFLISSPYE